MDFTLPATGRTKINPADTKYLDTKALLPLNKTTSGYTPPSFIANENLAYSQKVFIMPPNEKAIRIQEIDIKLNVKFEWYAVCLWFILGLSIVALVQVCFWLFNIGFFAIYLFNLLLELLTIGSFLIGISAKIEKSFEKNRVFKYCLWANLSMSMVSLVWALMKANFNEKLYLEITRFLYIIVISAVLAATEKLGKIMRERDNLMKF